MYTKPSKSIVYKKIHDKIFDQAFKSIVKETYLHSLVYDINEADEGSLEGLMQYADACCDRLGCKALLENAIASQITGPKKTLLLDIYKVCESSADEVADRATNSSDKSVDMYDDVPLEELVRSAGFTKDEFNKFQKNVDSLGLDDIGGIIQNKVRDVLQKEHDMHTRVDRVDGEISNIVNKNNQEREEAKADMQADDMDQVKYMEDNNLDEGSDAPASNDPNENSNASYTDDDQKSEMSDDEIDEALNAEINDPENSNTSEEETDEPKDESDDTEEALSTTIKEAFMCAIGVGSSDKLDHKSYFNTLQVAALENILWTENGSVLNPEEIKCDRLLNLTDDAGLYQFRASKTTMESLNFLSRIQSEDVRKEAFTYKRDIMDSATTDAINVYTMMECFHTLNLIPLKYNDVRKATESVQPMSLKITNSKRLVNNYLKQLSVRAAKESNTVSSIPAAHKLMNELESASEILHSCTESVDTTAMSSIDNRIEVLRKKLTAMESVTTSEKKVDPFILNQKKNVGIAQCNKVASMVKNIGPLAEAVVFEGTSDPNSYDVTIKRSNGIDAHTYVTMESISGNLDNDLKSFIIESNLGQKGMPQITFKKNDGKGTTEILKY